MKATIRAVSIGLSTSVALGISTVHAADTEMVIVSWGGAYSASQQSAYHEPYMAANPSIKIINDDSANEGVATAYKPTGFEDIPEGLKDPDGRWFAIHYGTLGLFVNVDALGGAEVPKCFADLTKPEYRGMVGYLDSVTRERFEGVIDGFVSRDLDRLIECCLKLGNSPADLDRDQFLDESFETIASFFENSLSELKDRNSHI